MTWTFWRPIVSAIVTVWLVALGCASGTGTKGGGSGAPGTAGSSGSGGAAGMTGGAPGGGGGGPPTAAGGAGGEKCVCALAATFLGQGRIGQEECPACPAGQICRHDINSGGGVDRGWYCVPDPCSAQSFARNCACRQCSALSPECIADEPAKIVTCEYVCAAPDTAVATPTGEHPIASLRVGDIVYSVDQGTLVAVPIARTTKSAVLNHHVVRVTLDTGRVVEMSAGHPTPDGNTFGELNAGAWLGSVWVVAAEVIPYAHPFTYDILPASDSGTYFAAGALVGSTLAAAQNVCGVR